MNITEFEKEKQYLLNVEDTLKEITDNNLSQIKIYTQNYENNFKDYNDKSTPSEVRKFLAGELQSLENSIKYLQNENYRYGKVKYSPYFAKINLEENNENLFYYIGTKNISNENTLSVIDWRTPVCSLFYNSNIGIASYKAPIGEIKVNLLSKRQFKIENSTLLNYYDISSKFCDDMLRESLNKSSSSYMQNIVSTLQSEQDEIIREGVNTSVIVNGIAGSGKTSIGMHRIAYLLYSDRENLTSKNVLIISPNKLFTEYISHLLPELGEENVTTENIITIFNNNMRDVGFVKSKNFMVEDIISGNLDRYNECKIKYNYKFFENLKSFLKAYNSKDKIVKDINISKTIIPVSAIKKHYYGEYQEDIVKSIEMTAERLVSLYFYQKNNSSQIKIKQQIRNYFLKDVFGGSLLNIYKQFLTQLGLKDNIITNGYINYEDMPALCYIKLMVIGLNQNFFIKQIFVDEMQDYDPITIALLRYFYPKANFTMVGDYEQNLLFTDSNKKSIEENFENSKFYNLTTNYRSTYNISKLACKVVGKEYKSSFVREGDEPIIKKTLNFEENIKEIKNILKSFENTNKRIAIICKTQEEVNLYSKYLQECFTLLDNKNDIEIQKPILTSVFYAKGLEFDVVILPNVSNENYNLNIDKNILYVAATRALHSLFILYINNKTKFLD